MKNLICDVDTGLDDMVAVMMALGAGLPVDSIICVNGNTSRENALNNTSGLLAALNKPVKLYPGSPAPLVRKTVNGGEVHGPDGLGGLSFPDRLTPERKNGIIHLIERVHSKRTTIVATGPLTDIALAIKTDESFASTVEEIVIMGGAFKRQGNITPYAEFNFFADPEAARIVMESGADIKLFPLDVTHQVVLTQERLDSYKERYSTTGWKLFADAMQRYVNAVQGILREACAFHDPCTIAYLVDPDIFSGSRYKVSVHTDADERYGQLTASESGNPVTIMEKADENRFWNLLEQLISNLD